MPRIPAWLRPPGGPPQWLVLTAPGTTAFFQITAVAETSPDRYTLTAKTTQLTLAAGQAVPAKPAAELPGLVDSLLSMLVPETPNVTAYVQSVPLALASLPLTSWSRDSLYPRQLGMLAPVSGSSVPVAGGQQIAPGQPVGVSGQCLRIQVTSGTFIPASQSGGLEAAAGQVFVTGSFPPGTDPATGNLLWTVTTLSGVTGTLSVPADAFTLLPSAAADPQAGEAAVVQGVAVSGDVATLTLAAPLARSYDASTVTVNANAVMATDGHTVQEILGSGDATNDALQFTLKQAPLTYLPVPAGQARSPPCRCG